MLAVRLKRGAQYVDGEARCAYIFSRYAGDASPPSGVTRNSPALFFFMARRLSRSPESRLPKKQYSKPPLDFEEQVERLKASGMSFDDEPTAIRFLSRVSYFRLSAYWYPFRLRDRDRILDAFIEGVDFSHVVGLYRFDRELRACLGRALERLEIAVRTQITYHLAHMAGAPLPTWIARIFVIPTTTSRRSTSSRGTWRNRRGRRARSPNIMRESTRATPIEFRSGWPPKQ